MSATAPLVEEEGLGALFHRLVDDGKRFARAEVAIQVTTVKAKATRSVVGVVLLAAALLFVIAGIVVLVMALGALIANLIGSVPGGFAIAAVIALALAGLLAKLGIGRITAAVSEPVA